MDMERPVAVITGASKGIGKQIAISMAQAGYDVAVNYCSDRAGAEDTCRQAEAYGAKTLLVQADVGSVSEIAGMFEQIEAVFPNIQVWVNNAGISDEAYFEDTTEEFFDRMTRVDWKGVYFCSQYAARHMESRGIHGVIVNITSNQADGCWPRATVYAPTKAAVLKFTKNAAMELSLKGIRMVAVAPGYTNVGWPEGDIRLEAAERLPMKRFATTEEVAQAVVYLTSPQAAYITGSCLTIDGGATLPVVAANDFVK